MQVAFCGPISLVLIKDLLDDASDIPNGYECPLMAYTVRSLLKGGIRVTVVTSCCDVSRVTVWQGPALRVIATPRRKHNLYFLDAYRQEVRVMAEVMREVKPDLVHANWTYEFADAALLTEQPCLVTAHDSPWTVASTLRLWHRYYRTFYSAYYVFPRIKNLCFVSPELERDCAKTLRLPDNRWVVPNGISAELFAGQPRRGVENLRAPVFMSTTGLNNLKNGETLLRAFARVKEKIADARLLLFGGGTEADGPASTWAQQKGLSEGVVFRGGVSHDTFLSAMEREADIFVHPSLVESFCMAVLEAMAKGLPCIGGRDSGAVPWLLDEGRAGVTVDVRSPVALADAMVLLAETPSLYAQVAGCGYTRAKECFTMDAVAKRYSAVYEEILNAPSAHGVDNLRTS